MPGHLNPSPSLATFSIWVDEKGGAIDAHIGLTVHFLFRPNAVGFDRLLLLVCQKRHLKRVLIPKLGVRLFVIGRNPDDFSVQFLKLGLKLAEIDGFFGAPRRVILWIKKHNLVAAFKVTESFNSPIGIEKGKIRGGITFLEHRAEPSFCLFLQSIEAECLKESSSATGWMSKVNVLKPRQRIRVA